MREPTVASVMTKEAISVRPETSFKAVVAIMATRGISAVPVVDGRGRPVGVVSEADALAKQEFHGGADDVPHGRPGRRVRWFRALALTAGELMTAPVVTIGADEPVAAAARRLAEKRVRRLFVVDDDGLLVGVVSRRDVLGTFLRGDEEIRSDIDQQVLCGDLRLAPGTVTVQVHDGVATVDGELEFRSATEVACRLVQAVPGVVGVQSNLRYRSDDLLGASAWTGFRP